MVDSETESSSSSSDEDPMSSMAASREKRVTAGNRMARLLEAEDEDDFYKTTYGGFEEVGACVWNCLWFLCLSLFVCFCFLVIF